MKGVSTRKYKEILAQMADTAGVSVSQISREFMVSSEKKFKQLAKWLEQEYPSAAAIQPPAMTGTSSNWGHYYSYSSVAPKDWLSCA